jgi:hypothetical protein
MKSGEPKMPGVTLTQRMAALEKQVKTLLDQFERGRGKDWRRTIGAFSGDEFMREVFAEGQRIREAERPRSRSTNGKNRKAGS